MNSASVDKPMAEMFRPLEITDYLNWIKLIVDQEIRLNDWETSFVQSLYARLNQKINLTELQAKKLESIYARTD
jgi:hypothetical protein